MAWRAYPFSLALPVTPPLFRIFKDRLTAGKWALSIQDAQVAYASSVLGEETEPIVADVAISSGYWRIFISDGQLQAEPTTVPQDDVVILADTVTGTAWRLRVKDAQLVFEGIAGGVVVGYLVRVGAAFILADGSATGLQSSQGAQAGLIVAASVAPLLKP